MKNFLTKFIPSKQSKLKEGEWDTLTTSAFTKTTYTRNMIIIFSAIVNFHARVLNS